MACASSFRSRRDTEAPAEMNFFFPDLGVLCLSRKRQRLDAQHPHARAARWCAMRRRGRIISPRRCASTATAPRSWSTSHAWPRFGGDRVRDFIASHRDAYKYLHDQTVRLMNAGYTDREIAEQVRLPEPLASRWFNRGYYGTMMHNSRAVYQRYMGWYDANPANLNPLPPAEEGDALRPRHGRRGARAGRRPARVR